MPKGKKKAKFYAVACGRKTGVFTDWATTLAQVDGFPRAVHKSFGSHAEAEAWVQSMCQSQTLDNMPSWRQAVDEPVPLARAAATPVSPRTPTPATPPAAPSPPPPVLPPLELSPEQRRFVELVVSGAAGNLLLSGVGGTGKSRALTAAMDALTAANIPYAAVAPTGVAAINVRGQTLNALAGIGQATTARDLGKMWAKKRLWRSLQVLLLDEISMVSAELLDWVDFTARRVREQPALPFGGIRLVLSGDLLQLPPVPGKHVRLATQPAPPSSTPAFHAANVPLDVAELSALPFQSACFRDARLVPIELTTVFRQADARLVRCLAQVRVGQAGPGSEAAELFGRILSRPLPPSALGIEPTRLYATNVQVDSLNEARLRELTGERRDFAAVDSVRPWPHAGSAGEEQSLWNDPFFAEPAPGRGAALVPAKLQLAVGAQVMLTANLSESLVNGSRGRVLRFEPAHNVARAAAQELSRARAGKADEDHGRAAKARQRAEAARADLARDGDAAYPEVLFCNGEVRVIMPYDFEKQVYLRGTCVRSQLPLRLAWALTMHKSQSATLDLVIVDLQGCFAEGQAYVALSRARSEDGLQVLHFDPRVVRAHPLAVRFCAALSAAAAEREPEAARQSLAAFLASPEAGPFWLAPLREPGKERAAWLQLFRTHEIAREWLERFAPACPAGAGPSPGKAGGGMGSRTDSGQ